MDPILSLMLVLGTSAITALSDADEKGGCDPLQYLSYDKTDMIECSFSDYYGVFWYNSTDSVGSYPLVALEDSKKSGDGYLSGEYDVHPNGSLVISTVSLKDDHFFRVILLKEKRGSGIIFDIKAYVIGIGKGSYGECDPLQYLFFGTMDTIKCTFSKYYGVYWYNSTDSIGNYPFVVFEDSEKSGDGYFSGEYDVYPNGSLIINTVSLKDDHYFRVILLQEKRGSGIIFDIQVYVVVKSIQQNPLIDMCGNMSFCFTQLYKQLELHCTVSNTRPPANLTWVTRNASEDWAIPFESVVSLDKSLYTMGIQTIVSFEHSEYTKLLVCKSVCPPDVVYRDEASVLVEAQRSDYPFNDEVTINVEMGKQLTLACIMNGHGFWTWKREKSNGKWKTIANIYFAENTYWEVYEDEYALDQNGSMIVHEVDIGNEGIYVCIHSINRVEIVKRFEVTVYVLPEPPHVTIQGCESHEICVLTMSNEGTLVCSLRGVRPLATLQWLPYPGNSSQFISFFNTKEEVVNRSDTFDISLTTKFRRTDATKTMLAVECRASEWNFKAIDMDMKAELRFINDQEGNGDKDLLIGLSIGAGVGILTGALLALIPLKSHRLKKHRRWKTIPNVSNDQHERQNGAISTDEYGQTQDFEKMDGVSRLLEANGEKNYHVESFL